jgi:putative ABC transport system permease protein
MSLEKGRKMFSDLWKCIWRELSRRKIRTLVNILGYLLAVTAMAVLISWVDFSKKKANQTLSNVGTHFIIFSSDKKYCPVKALPEPTEAFVVMGVASKLMPASYVEKVRQLSGVKDASPYLLFRFRDEDGGHLFTVGGFMPDRLVSVGSTTCSPMDIVSGRFLESQDKGAVMLESAYANARDLKFGDTLRIAGNNFKVIGIVAPAVRPAKADVYMHISDLAGLINQRGLSSFKHTDEVNVILVEVANAREQDKAIKAVKKIDPTLMVSSFACYQPAAKVIGMNEEALWMMVLIIGAALIFFSLVFQLSFVVSREHDIGILKAIGWSNEMVSAQILSESIIQALCGGMLGCLLASSIIYFISITKINTSEIMIRLAVSPDTIIYLLSLSLLGGIIAGIFPALYLTHKSPAEILRRI